MLTPRVKSRFDTWEGTTRLDADFWSLTGPRLPQPQTGMAAYRIAADAGQDAMAASEVVT